MELAFSQNDAEFQNLCQNVDTFVSTILHKTYINVNENGTEAAAITLERMETASYEPKEYYMNVNHSFIYMIVSDKIKDTEDKYIMPFIGIVNKLEGEKINETFEYSNKTDNDDDKDALEPRKFINSNYISNNKTILLIITYLIFLINS